MQSGDLVLYRDRNGQWIRGRVFTHSDMDDCVFITGEADKRLHYISQNDVKRRDSKQD